MSACGGSSSSGGSGSSTPATSALTSTSSAAGATSTAADPTTQSTTASQSAGSGAQGSSNAAGLKVFTSAGCGSCHTLAAAHANGNVGPNLDDLTPSAARVATQVTNGGPAMPSFSSRLSKAQIAAVAKFVASASG